MYTFCKIIFFNNVMHFPYNLLCKQIVFLPATKRHAVPLVLQLYPSALQPRGQGGLGQIPCRSSLC